MMEELLKYGRSIREFENNSNHNVFSDAQTYPVFFERHLVHHSRRLKIFIDDPNANLRAFYFQYLILLFEVENKNFEFYLQKLYNFILDPNFSFIFLESDDENIFNDQQFKRFFLEFLQILQSGQFLTVQQALNKYPIADIVFVYFFRSLLIYAQITNDFEQIIDKNVLFTFLLQNFNIDAAVYEEKCLKFFQAEVFVYEENPGEIYMAYMEIDNDAVSNGEKAQSQNNFEEFKKKSQVLVQRNQQPEEPINIPITKEQTVKVQIYQQQIKRSNQFRGYEKKQIITNQIIKKNEWTLELEKNSPPQNYQNYQKFDSDLSRRSPSSPQPTFKPNQQFQTTTYRTSRATTIQNREPYVPLVQIPEKGHIYSPPQPKIFQEPLMYEPKKNVGRLLRSDSKPSQSSFKQSLMKKLNVSNEFTDSLTLMKISEPYRTNIKKMKSRSRQYRQSLIRTLK